MNKKYWKYRANLILPCVVCVNVVYVNNKYTYTIEVDEEEILEVIYGVIRTRK